MTATHSEGRSKRQRIVVTGGAGFIGSHLCRRLLEQGHRVIAIDSLITGSLDNVSELHEYPDFSFFRRDVVRGITDLVRSTVAYFERKLLGAAPLCPTGTEAL